MLGIHILNYPTTFDHQYHETRDKHVNVGKESTRISSLFSEMVLYYCLFVCNIKTSSEGSRFHLPHVLFMFCFNVLFGGLDVLSIGGRIDRKVWSVLTSIKSLSNPVSFNLFHSTQYIILPSLILSSDIVLLSLSETPAKITLF